MRLLVWDCETNGMPDFKLPADHPRQPHIVEIAAVLYDHEEEVETFDTLIRPKQWTISDELVKVHGITTAMCEADGIPILEALGRLHSMFERVDVVSSYGFLFDDKMRRSACRRNGLPDRFGTFTWGCIQRPVSAACKMPATANMKKWGRGNQYKTPKLGEAVEILLSETHDGAHRALADCRAAARCLFAARKLGHDLTLKAPDAAAAVDQALDRAKEIAKAPPPAAPVASRADAGDPPNAPVDDLAIF